MEGPVEHMDSGDFLQDKRETHKSMGLVESVKLSRQVKKRVDAVFF